MASSSFNKFNSFVEAVAEGEHTLNTDQLEILLTTAANAPVATDAYKSDITEIAYTNLSSRNLTTSDSSQTSGTYKLTLADLTLSASGGPVATFRYLVINNASASGQSPEQRSLIGYYDFGSDLTLADGESLTLDFDGTNGVLTIT